MEDFKELRVVLVGTGYVGLVTGTCLAHIGHAVTCVDIDADKVARMRQGEVPIYEPGLEPLFTDGLSSGKLHITTDLAAAVKGADVIFLALPTPPAADGAADLSAVLSVAKKLGPLLSKPAVIVTKSTVPVGTNDRIAAELAKTAKVGFAMVSNPEFLREGLAVEDCLHPDRIVIGADDSDALLVMKQLYAPYLKSPEQFIEMDIRSAELTKYAANSFLAMKVSFINEIANLCERVGADVEAIRRGIGPDPRIGGKFLRAGIGYGGSCFPKDVEALLHTAHEYDYEFHILESIVAVNTRQKQRLFEKALRFCKNDFSGKRIAVWGLAFKPDTDDLRESPALELIVKLLDAGATVVAYDPHGIKNARHYLGNPKGLRYAKDMFDATAGADMLLLVTEWQEFRHADLALLKDSLKEPVIFDGRNVYDPVVMKDLGFHYESIGRPAIQ